MASAVLAPARTGTGALWRHELRALLALAGPLVVGNLAWAAIAGTDLVMLGWLGSDAVAAGALALNLYNGLLVFGMGLMTASSAMIAGERGRRLHAVRDIRRTVRQSLWSAVLLCPPVWLLLWQAEPILLALGQDADLAAGAARLMRGLMWALLPYLVFMVLRNFISALERPFWGMVVVAVAIPVNVAAGWVLILGHLGAPAMGLYGAGLASLCSALFMAVAMVAVVAGDRGFRRYHLFGRLWVPDRTRLRAIWALGLPIAITQGLEVGVFNAAAFLMGMIGRAPLAAHAVAIQIAALSFMVPMGIAQAATVRVGLAYGRRDHAAVGRAGWSAYALGTGYAAAAAVLLLLWPRPLIATFLDLADPRNAEVARLAVTFLGIAALFQLVDSAQAIGAGALRGLQDTRVPMIFAAVGYWIIGLGAGVLLAFPLRLRGLGIWLGLATGLGVVAAMLLARWLRRARLEQRRPRA